MSDLKKRSWNFVDIMTKSEIVEFLKQTYAFQAPEEETVVFFKWQIVAQKLQKEMDGHLKSNIGSEYARKIDELGAEFNEEKDDDKKLALLTERAKWFKKMNEDHKKWETINKKQEDNDALLERVRGLR